MERFMFAQLGTLYEHCCGGSLLIIFEGCMAKRVYIKLNDAAAILTTAIASTDQLEHRDPINALNS